MRIEAMREGEFEKAEEQLLIIKTTSERQAELVEFVKANHSYDVPEVLLLESSDGGNAAYMQWVFNSVARGQ